MDLYYIGLDRVEKLKKMRLDESSITNTKIEVNGNTIAIGDYELMKRLFDEIRSNVIFNWVYHFDLCPLRRAFLYDMRGCDYAWIKWK